MRIFFISDLHLSPAAPETALAFSAFLRGPAQHASALYILGDLFDYWIGDDQLHDPFYAAQCRQIVTLAARGIPVYFLPGNRDFLCGKKMALACGLTLLEEPSLIEIGNERVLLSHGDTLCTDDLGYQRYRRIVRNPTVQWVWLHLPRFIRTLEARRLRQRSQRHNDSKPRAYMDVNIDAVEATLDLAGAHVLIHGHTHRPANHAHRNGNRYVLPDWHAGQGGYLEYKNAEWHMRFFDGAKDLAPQTRANA